MVISKNGKRKKKLDPPATQSPATIPSPSTELPKRNKVHAQRKFAQGQGGGGASSSYSSQPSNQSQQGTPIKENREQPSELLPNIRPNTEDFLTFLCFRGTSVLPSHLDYLNTNKRADTATTSTATTTTTTDCSEGSSDAKPLEINKKDYNTDEVSSTTIQINKNEKKICPNVDDTEESKNDITINTKQFVTDDEKSKFIPFAVRKNAEKVSCGKRRQAVQALKKKYQEQRLAKTKVKNMNRTTSSSGGRQTRSSKLRGDNLDDEQEIINEVIKINEELIKKNPIIAKSAAKSTEKLKKNAIKKIPQQQPQQPSTRKTRQTINNLSLDTAQMPNTNESENISRNTVVNVAKNSKLIKNELPDVDGGSTIDKSTLQKGKRGKYKKSPKQMETVEHQSGRSTRQNPVLNLTKQIEQKKISPNNRKTNVKKPSIIVETISTSVKLSEPEFSSEDDEPLAKTIKRPINKTAGNDVVVKELIPPPKLPNQKNKNDIEENNEKATGNIEAPAAKKIKTNIQTEEIKTNPTASSIQKKDLSSIKSTISNLPVYPALTSLTSQTVTMPEIKLQCIMKNNESSEILPASTSIVPTTAKRRKRKNEIATLSETNVEHSVDNSTSVTAAPPTTSRPMRKTKTAAAIYMELIGQKLNLDDFDDDNNSMDSFPELPNVRKTEQMENELKLNVGKEKPKAKRIPKSKITINLNKMEDKPMAMQSNEQTTITTVPTIQSLPATVLPSSSSYVRPPKKISQKDENLARVDTAESLVMLAQGLVSPKKVITSSPTLLSTTKPIIAVATETTPTPFLTTIETVVPSKLEKSFSDSDDEPLMTKLSKKNTKTKVSPRKKKEDILTKTALATTEIISKEITVPAITVTSLISQQNTLSMSSNAIMTNYSEKLAKQTANQQLVDSKKIPDAFTSISQTVSPTKSTNQTISTFNFKNITTTATAPLHSAPLYSQIPLTSSLKEDTMKTITTTPFSATLNSTIQTSAALKTTPPQSPAAIIAATTTTTPTTGNSTQSQQQQAISAILANLMPSKEESGKIFGIASVTLAQSSGPNDTKCTLGKCGSIHKPSLGPVVPTEIFSLSDQMSSKERRKAKVNMTHEQIQKWLTECAPSTDYPIEDFLDDDLDLSTPPKPVTYPLSVLPNREAAESSISTRSPKTKPATVQQPLVRESRPATSSRGPSLKAKAIVLKDTKSDSAFDSILINTTTSQTIDKVKKPPTTTIASSSTKLISQKDNSNDIATVISSTSVLPVLPINVDKPNKCDDATTPTTPILPPPSPVSKSTTVSKPSSSVTKQHPTTKKERITKAKTAVASRKISPSSSLLPPSTPPKSLSSAPPKSSPSAPQKSSPSAQPATLPPNTTKVVATSSSPTILADKKPIYNQRRTPVYNTKLSESPQKNPKPVVNSFGAFSPENEPSIYSFDKEEDAVPTSTPFRRHTRRESNSSRLDQDQGGGVSGGGSSDRNLAAKRNASNTETIGIDSVADNSNTTTPNKTKKQQAVSLTLSPEDNSKSASIAVQGNMDISTLPKPSTSSSVDKLLTVDSGGGGGGGNGGKNSGDTGGGNGNDSDSDGHTFYIPLQSSNVTGGSKSDQLIQGVAVKLGTEGPEGPNQRVIMHAKLVTKAQMGTNTTPIPESMANVHEIVKSLIASKDNTVTSTIGSKSVPIGTVQPRFKSSGTVATTLTNIVQQSTTAHSSTSGKQLRGVKAQTSTVTSLPTETIKPSNNATFPCVGEPAQMVEALIFRPTEKEFQDPIEFIERITPIAARFGLCRIIPPASFKPECNISDDMRFSATNQYVHKMLHRWGPSAKEFSAIRKYLATQSITLTHPPWIGGMEVDLPRLYHTVQELGGLKEVIEKKKWPRVSEEMCIPKSAQDRVTKLDDIYCKYLLPYDTLSPAERQKLFDEVEADWAKTEAKARRNADRSAIVDDDDDEEDEDDTEEDDDDDGDNFSMECVVKGRSMALSAFFRIARNTMALWFKNTEPTSLDIESEYWRHVAVRDSHVCVHAGSIDSSGRGYGFPTPGTKGKAAAGAKHPWNLKILTNNQGSILRSIGACPGVTVPTLHVGMLFSAVCWYRDPHGLPWIEYLHTGGSKIWYGVPDEQSSNFRTAFTSLVPTHCQNKTVWLPCETAMVPPHMLTDRGVSLCRTEQEPGQFVVVFPRAYTSSLCTGYAISESVYFATTSWLDTARDDFMDMHNSCEPALFSLEQLLFSVATDVRTKTETLTIVLPMLTEVYDREVDERAKIKTAGIVKSEKLQPKGSTTSSAVASAEENECYTCRANLYTSWVKTEDENTYCLQHCIKNLANDRLQAKKCKLMITYTVEDMEKILKNIKDICNGASSQLVWQQQRNIVAPSSSTTKKSTSKRSR